MRKKKKQSARADGRGGWTPGKRRHADGGDWQRIRIRLAALLNDGYRHGVVSARAAAIACGVSDRTMRRWISGEDRPAPEMQEVVRQWVSDRRSELRPDSHASSR